MSSKIGEIQTMDEFFPIDSGSKLFAYLLLKYIKSCGIDAI